MSSSQFAFAMLKVCYKKNSLLFMPGVTNFRHHLKACCLVATVAATWRASNQCDGVREMAGFSKGVATQTISKCPKALYHTWCI